MGDAGSVPGAPALMHKLHRTYVEGLDKATDTFEYWATEHLRVSGVYWGLSALDLLGCLEESMNKDDVVSFIVSCQHPNGGFGGNKGHDPHLLYTLSALQVLVMFDSLDKCDTNAAASFVASLQQADGSFVGDQWGEVDTRFSYCAISALTLLDKRDLVNVDKAVDFIVECMNFDGGFGCVPGAESHSGMIFCCVGMLAMCNALARLDRDLLAWWLCERQTPQGGLNGRPEKKADVCYSWWVVSALSILDRLDWIDNKALEQFILNCQDPDDGGIADQPGDMADAFHTFFGLAGLALMGDETLKKVNPVYALSEDLCEKLQLPGRHGLRSKRT